EPSGSTFVVFRKPSLKSTSVVAAQRNGQSILPPPGEPLTAPAAAQLCVSSPGEISLLAFQPGDYQIETAAGDKRSFALNSLPAPLELTGPWEVRFQPNRGAPEKAAFDSLIDWSKSSDPGIKYFSGVATYTKTFALPAQIAGPNRR